MNQQGIINTLIHFLQHTNYNTEYKITVEYNPEIDKEPKGTIEVDGCIVIKSETFPNPYHNNKNLK